MRVSNDTPQHMPALSVWGLTWQYPTPWLCSPYASSTLYKVFCRQGSAVFRNLTLSGNVRFRSTQKCTSITINLSAAAKVATLCLGFEQRHHSGCTRVNYRLRRSAHLILSSGDGTGHQEGEQRWVLVFFQNRKWQAAAWIHGLHRTLPITVSMGKKIPDSRIKYIRLGLGTEHTPL